MRIVGYRVVEEASIERFERAVNDLIAQGWQPHGGPVMAPREAGELAHGFYQALVRIEDRAPAASARQSQERSAASG